jgi:hypothetical protein
MGALSTKGKAMVIAGAVLIVMASLFGCFLWL